MNDLIPLNNTAHLVATYKQTLSELETAFGIIKRTRQNLKNTLGEYRDSINTNRGYREEGFEIELIKRNFWKFIVDKTGLRSLLSTQKGRELDEQLEDNRNSKPLPEITEENIFNFLQENIEKAGDLVQEAIEEVFKILTPQRSEWRPGYKTNNEYEVGGKVILEGVVCGRYLNYYREDYLNAIDKLLHLLDGKGIPKYPDNLPSTITYAINQGKSEAETPYYRLKWYKKGTLHIEFKRLDLIKELNKKIQGRVKPC